MCMNKYVDDRKIVKLFRNSSHKIDIGLLEHEHVLRCTIFLFLNVKLEFYCALKLHIAFQISTNRYMNTDFECTLIRCIDMFHILCDKNGQKGVEIIELVNFLIEMPSIFMQMIHHVIWIYPKINV